MNDLVTRRGILRGIVGGAAVTVALPLLDCLLNDNGTAFANGSPLPIRFGTWFWGCGNQAIRFTPLQFGADWEITPELKAYEDLRKQINVFSNFDVKLDSMTNDPHVTALWAQRTGVVPSRETLADPPTYDVIIADAIGTNSRFKSLEVSCSGQPMHSYSRRSALDINPAEPSPMALYRRIFGSDFRDPNATDFEPDPALMARQSVLSAIKDQRVAIQGTLGASDRQKLEAYFDSLRQIEHQLTLQMQAPPPAMACVVPKPPDARDAGGFDLAAASASNKIVSELLAMALACNQTRVFNVVFNEATSSLHKPGESYTHHSYTHNEPVDPKLGYQPNVAAFTDAQMSAYATLIKSLAAIREGDQTLLDNCLVLGHSESSYARLHSAENLPMITAGSAGGRIKTGLHVDGRKEATSRVILTAMQVMGVPVERFGSRSMETNKPLTELLLA
ncbi:MAG TPA: DUF1552 domain-containing protein [Steroidobacteraceae bacterium]|jgi:hypothetical protein|nr:DUF1552 domain-containing protein [Steroidobacteraceae bacterium]